MEYLDDEKLLKVVLEKNLLNVKFLLEKLKFAWKETVLGARRNVTRKFKKYPISKRINELRKWFDHTFGVASGSI